MILAGRNCLRRKRLLRKKIFTGADIQHIGSTSVPGLSAKPIIDICVGLPRLSKYERYIDRLQNIGYTFMLERVFTESVFLPKGPEHNRTHYLHIVETGSAEHVRFMVFRDALRSDPKLIKAYDTLKVDLARQYADDRKSYTRSKDDFVKKVLNQEQNRSKYEV